LHDVPADGGHISELARSGEQKTLGDNREAAPYLKISGDIVHAGQGTDAQPAAGRRIDVRHIGQPIQVEETLGKGCSILHQTDQVRTARDKGNMGVLRMSCDRG
jgi:hypothetical protein